MPDINITHNELLEALRTASVTGRDYPDAMTTAEIVKATGYGEQRVRKQLKALIEQKAVEVVNIAVIDMAGRNNRTVAYRKRKAA